MDPTDDASDQAGGAREARLFAVAFALVAALGALDLAGDLLEGAAGWHVAVEAAATVVGLLGVVLAARRLRRLAREARALASRAGEAEGRAGELASRLRQADEDAARWKAEAASLIAGLGEAIDAQLVRWQLSAAEKEVALLLLKGLSHKEIAEARGTSEATVRQQARALYKKAGLAGRHDLAAFFLEDLLAR